MGVRVRQGSQPPAPHLWPQILAGRLDLLPLYPFQARVYEIRPQTITLQSLKISVINKMELFMFLEGRSVPYSLLNVPSIVCDLFYALIKC